jgi:hypothetical protein
MSDWRGTDPGEPNALSGRAFDWDRFPGLKPRAWSLAIFPGAGAIFSGGGFEYQIQGGGLNGGWQSIGGIAY